MKGNSGAGVSGKKLYSPMLLNLATLLANHPLSAHYAITHEMRSRTCGSIVTVGVIVDGNQKISSVGLKVAACAVGQASAAIMAQAITGKAQADLEQAMLEITNWLNNGDKAPQWTGFEALHPAQPHSGRHAAILLPWQAAIGALSLSHSAS